AKVEKKEVALLQDDSYIILLVPLNTNIDEIVISHELSHLLFYKRGYSYLSTNFPHYALYFLNNIILDILINDYLYEFYSEDLSKTKRMVMSHNLNLITNNTISDFYGKISQNQIILNLILIYVHNNCFKFEKTNVLLNKKIEELYPFVKLYGDKIINIIER